MTNDVSAVTGGASIAASGGSDGVQTVAASATTVAPPAAALNLAMQVGDCLLSTGMSANDAVIAIASNNRRLRTDTGPRRRDLYMHLGVPLFRAGDGADHLHQSGAAG